MRGCLCRYFGLPFSAQPDDEHRHWCYISACDDPESRGGLTGWPFAVLTRDGAVAGGVCCLLAIALHLPHFVHVSCFFGVGTVRAAWPVCMRRSAFRERAGSCFYFLYITWPWFSGSGDRTGHVEFLSFMHTTSFQIPGRPSFGRISGRMCRAGLTCLSL